MAYSLSVLNVAFVGLAFWLAKHFLARRKSSSRLPPGPPGLPFIGNVLDVPQTEPHKTYIEWGKKYGPIMHINALSQPIIILNDLEIATELLDRRSALYSDRPPLPMAGELSGWGEALGLIRYNDRFKEYRRYIRRSIGTRAGLERYHELIQQESRKLMSRIMDAPEEVSECIREAAGAIILKITYGYDTQGSKDPIVDLVGLAMSHFGAVTAPGKVWLVDIIPALKYVPAWLPGAGFQKLASFYNQTVKEMAAVPYDMVKSQVAAGTAQPSFVTELLDESNHTPDEEYNIKWAAASMYTGGADTVVGTVYTFFMCMTLYPEVQTRAQAEIDRVIGADRLPTLADRASLPYVEALVSEVYRWGPIGPLGIPHRLIQDDVYNDYFIPKGSIVFANIWAMLHDPEVHANPLAFEPERFIATSERPAERDPRVCCFGFGRRVCPGLNLADASVWLEIACSLATLSVSKARGADGLEITPSGKYLDGTVAHPEPFKCTIKPRSQQAQSLVRD